MYRNHSAASSHQLKSILEFEERANRRATRLTFVGHIELVQKVDEEKLKSLTRCHHVDDAKSTIADRTESNQVDNTDRNWPVRELAEVGQIEASSRSGVTTAVARQRTDRCEFEGIVSRAGPGCPG